MSITHITDHYERGLARLLGQFKDKPRIAALLQSWLGEVQELENALWDVFINRNLDVATGDLLAKLGALVGQPANGMDDDQYRLFIRARIKANRSNGKARELIAIVLLVNEGDPVVFRETIGAVHLETFGFEWDGHLFREQFLKGAAAAGVRLDFIFSRVPYAETLVGDHVSAPLALESTQLASSTTGETYGLTSSVAGGE